MTLEQMLEAVQGEIVRGIARYRNGQEYVVLARFEGGQAKLTPAGRKLQEELTPAKPRRTRVSPEKLVTPPPSEG